MNNISRSQAPLGNAYLQALLDVAIKRKYILFMLHQAELGHSHSQTRVWERDV